MTLRELNFIDLVFASQACFVIEGSLQDCLSSRMPSAHVEPKFILAQNAVDSTGAGKS